MIKKDLLKYAGKTKIYIFLSVFVLWLRLLANIAFSVVISYMLSRFLQGRAGDGLWACLAAVLLLIVLRQWAIRGSARLSGRVVAEVKTSLRQAVLEKVLRLGPAYQERLSTAEVIHMGMDAVEQLENYYGKYITQFYYCLLSGVTLFAALLPVSWKVGLLLLALSPIIPLGLRQMTRMVARVQKKYWKKYGDVGELFLDSLQGMTTLKIFRADGRRAGEIAAASESFRTETMRVLRMQLTSMIVIDFIAYGATAAGILLGLTQLRGGAIGLYEMILVLFFCAEFFVPMRTLTGTFHVAMTGMAAAEQMVEFLEEPVEERHGGERLPAQPCVSVRHLSFDYAGNDSFALRDIELEAVPGRTTAVVGPSGCGKSTLAALLCAQIPPPPNTVYLSGKELYSVRREEVAGQITRVAHNGHIFDGTVESNLRMAKPGADVGELRAVLEQVLLWDFFADREGLQTKTGSGGKKLSGGQAQRLSLARALLHDSKVYIFDEATSNIDAESERIILDVIRALARRKTVIVITHRLSSIRDAQHIVVMQSGRIEERGDHSALMQAQGLYHRLYTEQAELERFTAEREAYHGA